MERRADINTVPLENRVLLDPAQATTRYSLGRQTLRKIADEIGATVRIGRLIRFKRQVLDEWFESQSASKPGENIDTFAGSGGVK